MPLLTLRGGVEVGLATELRGGPRGDMESGDSHKIQKEADVEHAADLREEELTETENCCPLPTQIERESEQMSDKELDDLMVRATATQTTRRVLPAWNGQQGWLWRQWQGTIFEVAWPRALLSAFLSALLVAGHWATTPRDQLQRWAMPDPAHPLVARLKVISGMWDLQLTLTTFVTTFFMSHAYAFWRNAYGLARSIQGKLSDTAMLLSTNGAREPATGAYTPEARALLDTSLRRLSALHVLFWAGMVRRAPASDFFGLSFNQMLSRRALERLVHRGSITAVERDALLGVGSNPRTWHLALLAWVLSDAEEARRRGVLVGGVGLEASLHDMGRKLRAATSTLPDEVAARMPMAYVHFVQVLVDVLCLMAPFALFPRAGLLTVFLAATVCLFFEGLVELCKTFLDPFGNRRVSNADFRADVQVDVLIAESNAGLTMWPRRVEALTKRVAATTTGAAA